MIGAVLLRGCSSRLEREARAQAEQEVVPVVLRDVRRGEVGDARGADLLDAGREVGRPVLVVAAADGDAIGPRRR